MARLDFEWRFGSIMSAMVPWFPIWGIRFHEPVIIHDLLGSLHEWRGSERWGLIGDGVVASENHAWSAWAALRRLESRGESVARSPETEFMRIVGGTRQITEGIKRSGLGEGDSRAWLFYLPEESNGSPLHEMKISREYYNDLSEEAELLIGHLGGGLIPERPIPTLSGLRKIKGSVDENHFVSLEEAFIVHLSNSVIN
jgi:tRNA threonylcarbamoyladenosine modification (KEOPS) complex Cgi121 subunit